MDITKSIEYLHPTLVFWKDYIVSDDNQWEWPYIVWHNKSIKQPTQAELETAWVEVQALQQAEQTKKDKRKAILEIASETDQLNMIAEVLNTITSETPDQAIIDNAKSKFTEIKAILKA